MTEIGGVGIVPVHGRVIWDDGSSAPIIAFAVTPRNHEIDGSFHLDIRPLVLMDEGLDDLTTYSNVVRIEVDG